LEKQWHTVRRKLQEVRAVAQLPRQVRVSLSKEWEAEPLNQVEAVLVLEALDDQVVKADRQVVDNGIPK
tara:strand:+ start:1946 stop:2152 length:207 start_codon:yes stop_codon:yes gene_type:complete